MNREQRVTATVEALEIATEALDMIVRCDRTHSSTHRAMAARARARIRKRLESVLEAVLAPSQGMPGRKA